ncbi:hypothetical protein TIFTF001_032644 [Ficus carica]|uniref:Uncharacterized protein n=1 Tax=Ficus carica TaxID=3494 RepID=A0AA88DXJ9_FICCA|nr:hypothetical protein TIFTF001_032644 [Ficus carica]
MLFACNVWCDLTVVVERGRYMSTKLDLAKIGGVPNDSSNLHLQIPSHSARCVAGMVALEEI